MKRFILHLKFTIKFNRQNKTRGRITTGTENVRFGEKKANFTTKSNQAYGRTFRFCETDPRRANAKLS